MACNIEYKKKIYTPADFAALMEDPDFLKELEASLLTDMYLDAIRNNKDLTNVQVIAKVKADSGTTMTHKELQKLLSTESVRRENISKEKPAIVPNVSLADTSIKSMYEKFKAFLDTQFLRGFIGRYAPRVKEAFVAKLNRMEYDKKVANDTLKQLNGLLTKFSKYIGQSDLLAISNIMAGGNIDALSLDGMPDGTLKDNLKIKLTELALTARDHITKLSKNIAESGMLTDAQIKVFEDNYGKYTLRAYKAFINPDSWIKELKESGTPAGRAMAEAINIYRTENLPKRKVKLENRINRKIPDKIAEWTARVPKDDKEAAEIDLVLRSLNKSLARAKQELKRVENALDSAKGDDAIIDYIIEEIGIKESKESDLLFTQKSQLGIQLDSLKKRKDIPQWYRDLLGEITDPIHLYEATVKMLSETAAAYEYHVAFSMFGKDRIFSENKGGQFTEEVGISQYKGLSDVLGVDKIYVIPGTKDELISELNNGQELAKFYTLFTSISNWSMTVGAIQTQEKNLTQAPLFMFNNGNISFLNPANMFRAIWDIVYEIQSNVRDKASDQLFKFSDSLENYSSKNDYHLLLRDLSVKYGVTNTNVDFENIKNLAKSSPLFHKIGDYMDKKAFTGARVPFYMAKDVIDFLNAVYSESDNIVKIANFKVELDMFSKIETKKTFKELVDGVKDGSIGQDVMDRVVAKASKRARGNVPNYNEVYKIIKTMRNIPYFGVFSSFFGEQIRTTVNTLKYATEDIAEYKRTGNVLYATSAMRKFTGVALTAVAHVGFHQLASGIADLLGGDDEDDEGFAYVSNKTAGTLQKYYVAPWVSSAAFKFNDDTNEVWALNSEQVNPYGILWSSGTSVKNIMQAGKKENESWTAIVIGEIANALGPIIGVSIPTQVVALALSGVDKYGKPISDKELNSDPVGYIQDITNYMVKETVLPRTFAKELKESDWKDKVVNLKNSMIALQNFEKGKDGDTKKAVKEKLYETNLRIKDYMNKIERSEKLYQYGTIVGDKTNINLAAIYKARELTGIKMTLKKQIDNNLNDKEVQKEAQSNYKKLLKDAKSQYKDTRNYLGVDIRRDFKIGGFNEAELDFITGKDLLMPDLTTDKLDAFQTAFKAVTDYTDKIEYKEEK